MTNVTVPLAEYRELVEKIGVYEFCFELVAKRAKTIEEAKKFCVDAMTLAVEGGLDEDVG